MAHAKRVEHDTDALMHEVAALREDFGALTKELRTLAGVRSEEMTSRATDRVVALRSATERRLEDASEMATKAAHEARDYVKEHPTGTIAASAAAGFLIGVLTARR